jgi:hypothetical protein
MYVYFNRGEKMDSGEKSEPEGRPLEYLVERVKQLTGELMTLQEKAIGKGKRSKSKARALARKGEEWAVLIAIRSRLVRVHERGGFEGSCLTTNDLLEIHREQGGLCRYTNLPYDFGSGGPLNVCVDRLDPGQGWTRENVVLCALFAAVARNGWPMFLVVPLWRFLPTRWEDIPKRNTVNGGTVE